MKYRDRTTGHIYNSFFELQQNFSNVSFPVDWDASTYDFANVDAVMVVPQPITSNLCLRQEYRGVELINGQWTEVWNEVPMYSDPTEQAICENQLVDMQWDLVRSQRTLLLSQTDYTQLPDAQITAQCKINFQTYRQELRNITSQSDPYNIVWPTQPIYEKE